MGTTCCTFWRPTRPGRRSAPRSTPSSTGTAAAAHAHAHRAACHVGGDQGQRHRRPGRCRQEPARLQPRRRGSDQGMGHRGDQQADRPRPAGDAAMDHRRGAQRAARAGEDHERAPADGRRPRAAAGHRRHRPAGLRRHARRAHRRDRPGRVHQDREQGQDEPALRHRAGRKRKPRWTTQDPTRWSAPTGWPPASTRRTSASSTARSTCRRRSAIPRRSSCSSTFPARCSSTSTRSPTRQPAAPHAAARRRSSPRACASSGWATATRSWSTTPRR